MRIITEKTSQKLTYLEGMENSLIEWLQLEKAKIQRDILKVKANKNPNEKTQYANESKLVYVGELQNRILDREWKS